MSPYDRIISPTASQTATLVGEPEPTEDNDFSQRLGDASLILTERKGSVSSEGDFGGEHLTFTREGRQTRLGSLSSVASQLDAVTESPSAAKLSPSPFLSPGFNSSPTLSRSTTISSIPPVRPYSAFSQSTKWCIVVLGSTAALFSPLSSNIFVPAIPTLAIEFNKAPGQITLAVSVYLIFQAITPSFFGSMSDSWGRRPVFIGTLAVYFFANLGLAMTPTSAYWLLLVLRALQATGGSSVVSIGVGAVGDVAEPRERGKYMAIFQAGVQLGPSLGPVLGGIFASTLGWRSIFWFLVVASATVLIPLVLVYPETLRSLVGDGSIAPPAFSRSPLQLLQLRRTARKSTEELEKIEVERPKAKPYRPLSAFYILFTPEILLVFVFISFLYMEYYCVVTVYSTALSDKYGLTDLQIGLCYIPGGVGCIISSLLNGKQLDHYYQREEARVGGDYRAKPDEFRIYLTRLRCLVPFTACFLVGCTALGWCLHVKAPLPVTLVVNFFVGLGTGTTASGTVYGQDIAPGQGGAVSASLNILRCLLAALGTAFIHILYNAVGAGWTFVLLSAAALLVAPLPIIVLRNGDKWKRQREAKAAHALAVASDNEKAVGINDEKADAGQA